MSFFAANSECGSDLLSGVFAEGALADTGIQELVDAFASQPGKNFSAACEYLNVKNNAARRTKAETEAHLRSLLQFLGEEPEKLHEAAVKMSALSARMYLFSMSMVEMQSLLLNMKGWADAVPRESHPPAVARWKSDPENFENLLAALQSVFEERLAEERLSGGGGGGGSGGRDAVRKRYSSPSGASAGRGPQRAPGGAYDDEEDDEGDDGLLGDEDDEAEAVAEDAEDKPAVGGSLWGRKKEEAPSAARGRGKSLWGGPRGGKSGRGPSPALEGGKSRGGGDKRGGSARGAGKRQREADLEGVGADEKSRKRSGLPAKVALSAEDEEERSEEAPGDAVYAQWNAEHLKATVKTLDVALSTSLKAELPLTLAELQAMLDGIPTPVLRLAELDTIGQTLKKMKNLPKREKTMELLRAMQEVATAAAARRQDRLPLAAATEGPTGSSAPRTRSQGAATAGAASQSKEKSARVPVESLLLEADDEEDEEEEEKEKEERQDEEAVYEEWDKDHLQGALVTLDAAVSTGANAKLPLSMTELQALADGIPASVLRLANLASIPSTLKKMTNMPKRAKAMELLAALQKVAAAAAERQRRPPPAGTAERPAAASAEVEAASKLLIRRLLAVDTISDKDPIDSVEVSMDDTIEQVVARVFATLGLQGALKDFNFRRVDLVTEGEVTKAKLIPVEGTSNAVEAKEIVLCRKGG
jgi:hypothetical protein